MSHQARCPKCKLSTLAPAQGAFAKSELPERALECSQCRGLWVPHSIIDFWRNQPSVEIEAGEMPSIPPDDRRTGLCPFGHGILIRARVEADRPFHVERCSACRGVWLDKGEWQRLAVGHFLEHLDDLWDPDWRKRQRNEQAHLEMDASLQSRLGPELYEQLERAILPLARHPASAQVLAWIKEHLR